ncbi:MAG: peptide-methionine (S)-S-oxide reductase MsrA [Methanomicrobiales archaeon]|nr:peptide-methionine (S)-S-oxide reductase MsrA [Methanomicrobiales archaeon]
MDSTDSRYDRAIFAAGCFWDVEAAFRHIPGVIETVAGYTGGSVPDPSYDQVDCGETDHVFAVGVVFDPTIISYQELLERFFRIHDPAQEGGQGDYTGSQYRSCIFVLTGEQKDLALTIREQLNASEPFRNRPVLTEILPAGQFWPAEESHQQFYEKCGQSYGASRQIYE